MDEFESRTLALAGVFRAAALVNTLANEGTIADDDLKVSVESIFETDPDDVLQVFGNINNLSLGFRTLIYQFGKDAEHRNIDISRYVVGILFLERRLMNNSEMLETLSSGVELATRQSEHFSTTHENVIANIADLYSRTISKLGPRIMVNGEQHHLTNTTVSNKIRTVLLAGIRSAVLWQQLGGRRWHILFNRKKYMREAENQLNKT
ncbi:MAG: high frequency lysogenization protein HflD [Gammaproteobacteria bacterium]|nr:high frequency lysogenization protein HflD [Gammaproteobacteria bacterium]MCW8987520.1 high frequency lysogenization protein HflD [Gammaproteobacteria bacterium]MCW9032313.1 high frequency lysogenization protein HflD [Gammaproteobacteria bacterium]